MILRLTCICGAVDLTILLVFLLIAEFTPDEGDFADRQ